MCCRTTCPKGSDFRCPKKFAAEGWRCYQPHQDGYMQIYHDTKFDADQAEQVKWGFHVSCYVWGIVWYSDAFGERHHTRLNDPKSLVGAAGR